MKALRLTRYMKLLNTGTKITSRKNIVHKESNEFIINVGGSPAEVHSFITQECAYSHEEAINRANGLSLLYPQSDIIIEEWKFIVSDKFLVSGLYRGEIITIHANRKEADAA